MKSVWPSTTITWAVAAIALTAGLFATTDFSGRWKLDLGASSIPDVILEAQGLSWLEKQASKTLTVSQAITHGADRFTVVFDSPLMGSKQDLVLGGPFVDRPSEGGRPPYRIRAYVTNQGDAVAVETVGKNKKGMTLEATLIRTLEDGGQTMRQRIFFRSGDGTAAEGVRVFRKVK